MNRRIVIPAILIFLAALPLIYYVTSALLAMPKEIREVEPGLTMVRREAAFTPGNYCIACHLADDTRLPTVMEWTGDVFSKVNSPCPAAIKIHEELYYTERLLLMIDRTKTAVGELPEETQARLTEYTEGYSRLLDEPVTSLDAFVNEAQAIRYQLNKVYTVLNELDEAAKLRTVFIFSAGITLIVLGSLAWGLYHTRGTRPSMVRKPWTIIWKLAYILAVLVVFALPIFRPPDPKGSTTTVEQQLDRAILDDAQRAAEAADHAQGRVWMLARIGATWAETNPEQASVLFEEALGVLETARDNKDLLWGQSLAVQEVNAGHRAGMESANLIASDLQAVRAHDWALPLLAREWNKVNPEKVAALLRAEQARLQGDTSVYRDLQMRGLALAWIEIESNQAIPAAMSINDPALRSWTLRELAQLTGNRSLFERAAQAAQQVEDLTQRAYALREVAAASGNTAYFEDALEALADVRGALLAYALRDLAADWGNVELVDQITPPYPDARASALLRLGEYEHAWDAAVQIVDPYERARAEAAVATAWGNAKAAKKISIPLYRDLALRNIAQDIHDPALIDSISTAYYKVQTLTSLGDLDSALALVGDLSEPYPLVALATALAEQDEVAALALVDQMSRETDKAAALRAIAATSKDEGQFTQAQGMAWAGRLRGDVLAPVRLLLDLAQALQQVDQKSMQTALQQAYEAVQRIK